MRESPLHVMAGSLGALWLMTVLSAGLGAVATKLARARAQRTHTSAAAPRRRPPCARVRADLAVPHAPRGHRAVLLLRPAPAVQHARSVGVRGQRAGGGALRRRCWRTRLAKRSAGRPTTGPHTRVASARRWSPSWLRTPRGRGRRASRRPRCGASCRRWWPRSFRSSSLPSGATAPRSQPSVWPRRRATCRRRRRRRRRRPLGGHACEQSRRGQSPGLASRQRAPVPRRSQDNVLGVVVGACLGHLLCTGGAVAGGRTMAAVISERAVQVCGGVLFLLFGLHSLLADNV